VGLAGADHELIVLDLSHHLRQDEVIAVIYHREVIGGVARQARWQSQTPAIQ
jgi:hypothetical protein